MTTVDRLTQQLRNIVQLSKQVEQVLQTTSEVQATHPEQLKEAEQLLTVVLNSIKQVREEDEVSIGYLLEVHEALAIIIDRLNNAQTVQDNLDFIQATDKDNLKRFLGFVLEYSLPIFEEVVNELKEEQREKLWILLKPN